MNPDKEIVARVIALGFLLFLPLTASADTLTGEVVKIKDGDIRYVLDANYQQHKIRLAGIDAPERKQAYGLASCKHLASIVAGNQAREGRLGLWRENNPNPPWEYRRLYKSQ